MTTSYKIVITGPFSAGKSQFVKTISDIAVVSTERKISRQEPGMKSQTTVAMDYGRVQLEDVTLHLHGTPGQARFDFMWDILTKEMAGFVVVVDSTDPSSMGEARELIKIFSSAHNVPYVIAANKQDVAGALPIEKLRRELDLSPDILIMPCVASRKTSVKQVLAQLVELL